jgi:hypothetical protein
MAPIMIRGINGHLKSLNENIYSKRKPIPRKAIKINGGGKIIAGRSGASSFMAFPLASLFALGGYLKLVFKVGCVYYEKNFEMT